MPNVLLVTEAHIQQWNDLLNDSPLINDDLSMLEEYVRFIHLFLDPQEKGADLGKAMFVADSIQGANADLGVYSEVTRISAEVNNRMFAHLIYNKQLHKLEFVDPEVEKNPTPKLIEMAQYVLSRKTITDETSFTDIGIEGITFFADKILD